MIKLIDDPNFKEGAATSTSMNANEVIANIALEILGEKKGSVQYHSSK